MMDTDGTAARLGGNAGRLMDGIVAQKRRSTMLAALLGMCGALNTGLLGLVIWLLLPQACK